MKARGYSEQQWAYPARAPIYARLHQGDLAHDQIQHFIRFLQPNLISGLLQFDGTPAAPESFAEMLLQSQLGYISLLPALPKAWPTGSVKGLRARGGFEVDEAWKDGKLASVTIRSIAGNAVNVRYGAKTTKVEMHPGESVTLDGDLQLKDKV